MSLPACASHAWRAAVLATAVALAACQPQAAPKLSQSAVPEPAAAAEDLAADPAAVEDEEPAAEEIAAVPAGLAEDPARLRGLAAPLVQAALGPPSFRRRDRSAEIWQYYGDGCILDLFLYDEDGHKRVVHYTVRGRGPGEPAHQGCLPKLLRGDR